MNSADNRNQKQSGRRSWSVEQKRELVENWRRSGMSRMQFCREQGLSYGNFLGWEKRLSQEGTGFVEVLTRNEGVSCDDPGVEVIAPNGWRVRLGRVMLRAEMVEALQRMFAAVGQC